MTWIFKSLGTHLACALFRSLDGSFDDLCKTTPGKHVLSCQLHVSSRQLPYVSDPRAASDCQSSRRIQASPGISRPDPQITVFLKEQLLSLTLLTSRRFHLENCGRVPPWLQLSHSKR